MTILECIKEVLTGNNQGLTAKEIYALIIEKGLYSFGATHPVSVVSDLYQKALRWLRFCQLRFQRSYSQLLDMMGKDRNMLL